MSTKELLHVVSTVMAGSGCQQVQLSGGEPLLRRDLLSLVEGLVEAGALVSLITDGAHLDGALARSLAERGVKTIQPTLLAGEAAVHDSLRGSGAFRAATRAIAVAAHAGLEVSVCMVITRVNFGEARRVAELAFALGARGLALSRFCPAGAARRAESTLMPDAQQVRQAAESAAEACRSLNLPLAAAVTIPRCVWSHPEKPPMRVGVCSLVGPKTTMTIGPDGAVRSCSLSTHSVGNLRNEPWEVLSARLWDTELRPLRERVPDACRDCAELPRCLGGCRLSAPDISGCDPLARGLPV